MSHGSKLANHRFARIVVPLVIVIAGPVALLQAEPAAVAREVAMPVADSAAAAAPTGTAAKAAAAVPTGTAAKAVYFHTLPLTAKLPSGATCARLVNAAPRVKDNTAPRAEDNAAPRAEDKAANKPYNKRTGKSVTAKFLAFDGRKAQKLARRINGDFTGTTIDILRWAACKWGIDQDIVFAQAAVESWWQQNTLGGWTTNRADCPPGDKPGQDGKPGECPVTYGILQDTYGAGGWPAIARSTAMNADAAYAVWRSCYEGYETWLNTVPRGSQYHKGDVWGCVGRWFSGQWRNPPALGYIAQVKKYLREKIWLTPDFQQGH
jgi:autotransporter family porin